MDPRNVKPFARPLSEVFGDNPQLLYEMPKFQRVYAWEKRHWDKFFKDIAIEEEGHFLGSIIAIEPPSVFVADPKVMIIDGQQRLTTISLFLAALYSLIRVDKGVLNEDQATDFMTLKRRLIQKNPGTKTRIIPQNQDNNYTDYIWLLGDIEVTNQRHEKPIDVERRKLYKAYSYFRKQIEKMVRDKTTEEKLQILFSLVDKMMSAILVVITVSSFSDAFQLFESLNNRGEGLNKIDLLKNIVLSRVSIENEVNPYHYSQWTRIINNVGGTVSDQERFFRVNYNAFRKELNNGNTSYPIAKVATQSNLLDVYYDLTNQNVSDFLEKMCDNSELYAKLTLTKANGLSKKMKYSLRNLSLSDGTTSYVLLMHLLKYKERLNVSDEDIIKVINALVIFQVRRGMTKMPPTNRMLPHFNGLVEYIESEDLKGAELIEHILQDLREFSAGSSTFEEALAGNVYENNRRITALMLKILAHKGMTAENERDLWDVNDDGNYIWTIEHIMPQGKNLPQEWVDMIANGDTVEAKEIQKNYVHKLGNLTITAFNSNLSNKPFVEKRDLRNEDGKFIGYKNGLNLNKDVCNNDKWQVEDIRNRTENLTRKIMETFTI